MYKLFYPKFLILCSAILCLFSCGDEKPKEIDLKSVSGKSDFREVPAWIGSYQDTLPCNDCIGILTRLDLKSDTTYKKSILYIGKGPVFENTFSTKGRWKIDNKLRKLQLDSAVEKELIVFEIVGDSILKTCDQNGNPIPSPKNWLPKIM